MKTEDSVLLTTIASVLPSDHHLAAAARAALAVGDDAHIAATAEMVRRHAPREATVLGAAKKALVSRVTDYAPSVFLDVEIESSGHARPSRVVSASLGYSLQPARTARVLVPIGMGAKASLDTVRDAAPRLQLQGSTVRAYLESLAIGQAIEFPIEVGS